MYNVVDSVHIINLLTFLHLYDIVVPSEVIIVSAERIVVTEGIKKLIVSSRKGKHLTATDISKAIKNSDYWLQNIENGRTKTISREDLISILKYCLDCTTDIADELIASNLKPSASVNPSATGSEKEINLYPENADTLADISKYRSEFDKFISNTNDGFELFFNGVNDKEIALKFLRNLNRNLHSDLGFMISLFSLNWCMLSNNSIENKKQAIKDLSSYIKEHGTCSNCKKSKSNLTECNETTTSSKQEVPNDEN